MKRVVLLCVSFSLLATTAEASGFYFGDNGSKAMIQGGAFTAQADDLTAMAHNPAGLAQQQGFSFLADIQLLRHDVSYLRQDPGFDATAAMSQFNDPNALIRTVSSQKDPYILPYFGLGYGFRLFGRPANVSLGLFAPPSQGHYQYTTPNYTKNEAGTAFVENPRKFAPQRYAMISNDIIIAYPTLSLAYEPHPMISIGVSAQLTVSNFKQVQTLYGEDALGINPMSQLMEKPDFDATVAIDLQGQVGFTGVLGLLFKPTKWLAFGASVRPPIPFRATGRIDVQLSGFLASQGTTVTGDRDQSCSGTPDAPSQCTATLTMTLPLEVRFGARLTPMANLGINLDFVVQGWNSVDQLLLEPNGLKTTLMGNTSTIPAFGVKKNWLPTFSARLGATYKIFQVGAIGLSASAGVLFETGASPINTYSVDWTHPTRFIFTGGVTGHLGTIDVIAGFMGTPTQTTVIGAAGDANTSIVQRGQTRAESEPAYVGNGIYTSGGYGVILGLRGRFGGEAAPRAEEVPAPAPAPADAPPATTEEAKPAASEAPAPAPEAPPAPAN